MRAKHVDSVQPAIVAALRAAGASVLHLHEVGKGCPDLLVGIAGRDVLVEVKTGKGKLNELQRDFHASWKGRPVTVLRTAHEAFLFARAMALGAP